MSELKMIHKGSTKDVFRLGSYYLFKFSDRYSVFDWGEMPDQIDGKGQSLALFTKKIYEKLSAHGIKHHLINGKCEANEILVQPYEVIRDGSMPRKDNTFIPLEVIFRLGVASGSSLLKRFKTEADWTAAGFDRAYAELEMFDLPKVEFTTKLERFDRPLTHPEAKHLANLNDIEWSDLITTTQNIALELKKIFSRHDITLWDGKVEFAAGHTINGNRDIILVDSIGPDELRLTRDGVQLSKEIMRQYYRPSTWYKKLDDVKAQHGDKFKDFISPPEPLNKEFKQAVEELYNLLPDLIDDDSQSVSALKLQKLIPKLRGFTP